MNKLKHPKTSFSLIGLVTILAVLSISPSNNFCRENVFAQNSTNSTNVTGTVLDSFQAQGQISSLASNTLAGRENSIENVIWVLGGNWEFNVVGGNYTNFVVDIDMTQVDGTAAHTHTIEKLNNVAGMPMGTIEPLQLNFMTGEPSSKIALVNGNSAIFMTIIESLFSIC